MVPFVGLNTNRIPAHPAGTAILITAGCNLVGVAHGSVYGWLAVVPSFDDADRPLLAMWAAGALSVALAIAPCVLYAIFRPIEDALERGADDPALLERARRLTLNLPIGTTRASS